MLQQTSVNIASIRTSRAGSHACEGPTSSSTATMPPRAAVQTTLDTVFAVKQKRSAAEVAAASGGTPMNKRRKVSKGYTFPRRSLVEVTDSCNALIVRR